MAREYRLIVRGTGDTVRHYLCDGNLSRGELFDAIVNSPHFKFEDEDDVAHVMKDAFRAVAYLHDAGIVHRDLKPENLMLSTRATASNLNIQLLR